MNRVLVTGGSGLVGRFLLASVPSGVEVCGTRRRLVDLATSATVVEAVRPDVVVHTAYDLADLNASVVSATRAVAAACASVGAALVHLSSDVVFDGEHAPYGEGDHPDPVHDYGRAKAQAEGEVVAAVPDAAVVRTSLVCWGEPLDPRSAFVVDGLRAGEERRMFTDEIRCPIRADDLAAQLWDLVTLPRADRGGPWHLVGPEALSRHALGVLLAEAHGLDPARLVAVSSRDQPDPRPRDLTLTDERAAGVLPTRPRPVGTLFA